ncbi:hypothetical protein M595_2174 [Lyngbya aestuarii BL J]|uniref:Uncharacterized protein n=1 Tax=Lyngbya aestuarii BL J TaxID=1348334 RepID=U7QN31_9CYAN|nr:hypothetical protein M595_2174 [Lyngbya aestuarii BL J]
MFYFFILNNQGKNQSTQSKKPDPNKTARTFQRSRFNPIYTGFSTYLSSVVT